MANKGISPELLNLFPKFDGVSETFDQYLEKFDKVLNAFDLNKVKAFKILPCCVTGRAERYYRIAKKKGRIVDYDSLITELAKLLITEVSQIKAKQEMRVEIRDGEKIDTFAERVNRNVQRAYPQFAKSHQEYLAADIFVAGCPKTIRGKLLKETQEAHLGLSDLLEKAEMYLTLLDMKPEEQLETKIDKLSQALQNSVNFMGQRQSYYSNEDEGAFNEESSVRFEDDRNDDYIEYEGLDNAHEEEARDLLDEQDYFDDREYGDGFQDNEQNDEDRYFEVYHQDDMNYGEEQFDERDCNDYPGDDHHFTGRLWDRSYNEGQVFESAHRSRGDSYSSGYPRYHGNQSPIRRAREFSRESDNNYDCNYSRHQMNRY